MRRGAYNDGMHMLLALALMIGGVVRDTNGEALPGATVFVKGTQTSVVTDANGRFSIAAPTGATLVVYLGGFEPREVPAHDGLEVALELAAVAESVTVTASVDKDAPMSTYERRPLDIVRTPGAQADIFRALQTLPGVAKADEGAGLFVRGGDVAEAKVMLDGVTIAHPYRYESANGGQFGAIEPFLLQGIAFSTGGFSARFGNALSAIVDLRGQGKPSSAAYTATAGLAGLAGRVALPQGFRASGNLRNTRVLFAVNGAPREFSRYPAGWDFNVSAHFGGLRVFAMEERSGAGFRLERESFDGFADLESRHDILALQWRAVAGAWQLNASAGGDVYSNATRIGVVDLENRDVRASWRFDMTRAIGTTIVRAGTDGDAARQRIRGTTSVRGGDYAGISGTRAFDVDYDDRHAGVYAEGERSFGRLTPTVGIRADASDRAGSWVDPRVSVAFALAPKRQLRVAWGIYHQAPAASYYDRVGGARTLLPMRATHLIAGFEQGDPDAPLHVRVEAYSKRYDDLPLDDPARGFTSDGYGRARGVDLFAQRKWRTLELRGSYSFLDAQRRWTPVEQRRRYPLPEGTWRPDFATPHSLSLSATKAATPRLTLGAGWMWSSGRPFTPIVGSADGAPVYGSINSDRLPPYARLDANASYRVVRASGRSTIWFAGVTNVLARENFFEYAYSEDFRERRAVVSFAPRSVYVGITIQR